MSGRREKANRWGRGAILVCAAWTGGGLLASCSSETAGPPFPAFVVADCKGALVELARFPQTFAPSASTALGSGNNLALEGDTLFMTYAFAATSSNLPISGGIVAVPVSGGPPRVVAAAENTSQWGTGSFWVSGGQVYMQTASEIRSVPADSTTPAALSTFSSAALYDAYARDAEFGYSAQGTYPQGQFTLTKTPIGGGAPTVLVDESLPDLAVGGLAEAGDAVLVLVRWHSPPAYDGDPVTRLWRVPKDGSAHSDVRPDVHWGDPLGFSQWLAWDGQDILGAINVQNYIGIARVTPTGTAAPDLLKLQGVVATRRGDEVLSFQVVQTRTAQTTSARLLVASSKGGPAGSLIACGSEGESVLTAAPAGIAADDNGIYVSYKADDDTVIARVEQ